MALFIGGPYNGHDLPFDPDLTKIIRLPLPEAMTPFAETAVDDPGATGKQDWPFLYKLDESVSPPWYRFVEEG